PSQNTWSSVSYDTAEGSKTTSTTSACPVRAVQTSSYVGLGVCPPAYPTAVEYTPGVCQNRRSAPQKQPSPNTAVLMPSGNGGLIRRSGWTACSSGVTSGSGRPGRASSADTKRVLSRPKRDRRQW